MDHMFGYILHDFEDWVQNPSYLLSNLTKLINWSSTRYQQISKYINILSKSCGRKINYHVLSNKSKKKNLSFHYGGIQIKDRLYVKYCVDQELPLLLTREDFQKDVERISLNNNFKNATVVSE